MEEFIGNIVASCGRHIIYGSGSSSNDNVEGNGGSSAAASPICLSKDNLREARAFANLEPLSDSQALLPPQVAGYCRRADKLLVALRQAE